MRYLTFIILFYTISAPNGINANRASLKDCLAKGIPMIVIHRRMPLTTCARAIGRPETISQMILTINDMPDW